MGWEAYPDRVIAERVCTKEQLDVLILWSEGKGRRNGARALGISEDAWRTRLARALGTIERAKREAA
jgi:DNA-binding CsgD family transcriptional regulator